MIRPQGAGGSDQSGFGSHLTRITGYLWECLNVSQWELRTFLLSEWGINPSRRHRQRSGIDLQGCQLSFPEQNG